MTLGHGTIALPLAALQAAPDSGKTGAKRCGAE